MTTADERAASEEIAILEAAAQRHVAALTASSLVEGKARVFLEEIAFRSLDRPFPAALASAAAQFRLDDSAQCGRLLRLLTEKGVVAEDGGRIRFVPDALRHYLAAYRVYRRNRNGPSLLNRRHRFLKPHTAWPWHGSDMALYLVALWWPEAEKVMRKNLDALLSRKHRDPNVHFVAELLHRGLVRGDDLRTATVEILRGHLAEGVREIGRWRMTVRTFVLLEPEHALDALENLVQHQTPSISPRRRLDAVDELTEQAPARGKRNILLLAETLNGTPRERLDVAVLIRERDTGLGDRTIRRLADDPYLGDLQAEAAQLTGDPALWATHVGTKRDLSDEARLGLLTELTGVDEGAAVAAAERFADTARDEETPVTIAKAIQVMDPDAALRIADEVAWPTRRPVTGPVRLSAVHLIGDLVPIRRFSDLDRLARDATAGIETQFQAAVAIVERGGPVTTLYDFAANPKVDRPYRLRAARKVGVADRDLGGRLLVAIATTYGSTDRDQLVLLHEACALAPAPAIEALQRIVHDQSRPATFRIQAVELGVFDKAETIRLYSHIALTTADREAAYTAASKVRAMDPDEGERVMGQLASAFPADEVFQLRTAREAGEHGKAVLRQLAFHARTLELRRDAADPLCHFDPKSAAAALNEIVTRRGAGEIRISAALLFPPEQALVALRYIVDDQDHETVRFEAGVKAMGIDEEFGGQALLALARAPGISEHTREQIRRYLGH